MLRPEHLAKINFHPMVIIEFQIPAQLIRKNVFITLAYFEFHIVQVYSQ